MAIRAGVCLIDGLAGQRIVLGITGGIAAYKAADLARRLGDAGAQVRVVMTDGAQRFVAPLTFQALTGQPVRTSLWDEAAEAAMGHIELARWATRIVVAPASADFIARLAQGLAGDLLGTLCLATEAPIAVVPAMNRVMWANAATRANVDTLRERGIVLLGPAEGDQACGEVGAGRMLEPLAIVAALAALAPTGALTGKRLLVSAGPTCEDIDPVRFLGNRSSGKMGFALAAEAAAMGARVTLVAGPVSLPTPAGVRRIDVRRALEMREAVLAALPGQDVYIGAAAIADYMPAQAAPQKIKKHADTLQLDLVRTPDVLAEVARHASRPQLVVGFAAETEQLESNALAKLRDKQLDLIAGNDVSTPGLGFGSEENALQVWSQAGRQDIARGPKPVVARALLELIAARLS
ncbi:MAG: bifunctional phosphopantothenoylcysteine decarboxylase/phosphopantothenate--cysteine ligase CoaBC [Arenimonas sp.]